MLARKVAALDLPTSEPSEAFEALVARVDSTQLCRVDCDITDRSTVEAALKNVAIQLGYPTVLVNNAGLINLQISRVQDIVFQRCRLNCLAGWWL